MLRVDVEQGSQEWLDMRRGMITASEASKLLAGEKTETYKNWIYSKVADLYARRGFDNEAMKWGREQEGQAVEMFLLDKGISGEKVGFIKSSIVPYLGASPDYWLECGHGLEVKCPFNGQYFVSFFDTGKPKKEWELQCQFSMLVTECELWELAYYDPEFPKPLITKTIERDEKTISELLKRAAIAHDQINELSRKMEEI